MNREQRNYNEGIETGLKVAEAMIKRENEAMNALGKNLDIVKNSIGNIKEIVDSIVENQENSDIEKLYGIIKTTEPKELEREEKKILLHILSTIANQEIERGDYSVNQKEYFNSLRKYLEIADYKPDINYDFKLIGNIDSLIVQKCILQCIHEFLFLKDNSFESLSKYYGLLDEFSVKKTDIEIIDALIEMKYRLFGSDGVAETYNINATSEEESTTKRITIDSLIIHQGEIKEIENAEIHINSKILCYGTLKVTNSIINYNEPEANGRDEIRLEKNAILELNNCVIKCYGTYNKENNTPFCSSKFIYGEENNIVIFEECTFENCNSFLGVFFPTEMRVEKCKIVDCVDGFIYSTFNNLGKCVIRECSISENRVASYNMAICKEKGKLFELDTIEGQLGCCEIANNEIAESESFRRAGKSEDERNNEICYFRIDGCFSIENCSFVDATNCFEFTNDQIVSKIANCRFENCKNIISGGKIRVDACGFIECTEALTILGQSCISNCFFEKCYDLLIEGYGEGNVIESCEFRDIKWIKETELLRLGYGYLHSCIAFKIENGSMHNTIRKCVFNGIDLKDGFLIQSFDSTKPSGKVISVEDCVFENCITERSSGKIIDENIQYDTLFKKQIFQAVYTSGCKGLN